LPQVMGRAQMTYDDEVGTREDRIQLAARAARRVGEREARAAGPGREQVGVGRGEQADVCGRGHVPGSSSGVLAPCSGRIHPRPVSGFEHACSITVAEPPRSLTGFLRRGSSAAYGRMARVKQPVYLLRHGESEWNAQ